MSKVKIEKQVYKHAAALVEEKGFVSPVDLLIRMDRLTPKQVENWRLKKIPFLEQAVSGNLANLNHILKSLKRFAEDRRLRPSKTKYHSWGKGAKKQLQFSKGAKPFLEEQYATHYVQNKKPD